MTNEEIFSEEQINSICSNIPEIEAVEELRVTFRKKRVNYYLILLSIIVVAGAIFYFLNALEFAIFSGIILLVLAIIFWYIYVNPAYKKLKDLFKEVIINHYICSLLPGATYEPAKYHSLHSYYESNLFTSNVDRHNGANYVKGVFDKTELSFSYMHTEYKEVTHSKNGTKTTWHTIFEGVFMQADSNKNFEGKTVVLPDTAEKMFGSIGKWMQKNSGNPVGQMVYMENVKFEKEFVVYSTDPVEARYLLTPKIQEQILHLKHFIKRDVRLSFVNNHIFIAISRGNLFNLDTSLSFNNTSTLKYYMKDVIELLSLVNILDLNTRIWGKN